ncbi:hypothetical protein Acr_17g0009110 [Actinidia rufa]|uniref:Transmembrane protein n=1 Tax=Actinidia rufa TaxID=165716 RepID=A0A7J0G3J2_9ERIC|nr:hypothetical protein Acr_17g0009110 [Actinidia rufa]
MEISAKLLKFKFHILIATAFSLVIFSLIYLAPGFLNVVAYFWPLFVSTALFLVAVVLFGRTPPPDAEAPGEKAGEGFLGFVAPPPEEVLFAEEIFKPELN